MLEVDAEIASLDLQNKIHPRIITLICLN